MGTQQLLFIILALIIIGTSIGVGIKMYDTYTENNLRQAMSIEIKDIAQKAQLFYIRPDIQGGFGAKTSLTENDITKFYTYFDVADKNDPIATINAEYKLDLIAGTSLELKISGKAKSNPDFYVTGIVDLKGVKGEKGIKIKHKANNASDYPSF